MTSTDLRLTVDWSLGGGHWGWGRGVDRLLGGRRFVHGGSRGGLGVDRLGRGYGDWGGGRGGRDVDRVRVGLQIRRVKESFTGDFTELNPAQATNIQSGPSSQSQSKSYQNQNDQNDNDDHQTSGSGEVTSETIRVRPRMTLVGAEVFPLGLTSSVSKIHILICEDDSYMLCTYIV